MVQREKQMRLKQLLETGRIMDPSDYAARKPNPRKEEPFKSSITGKMNIDL